MKLQTLAHLSDLHLGRSLEFDAAAARVRDAVVAAEIDHLVITGDLTNRGRRDELARFDSLFGGLVAEGRVTIVPGNHDRLGDDVGARFMGGRRVEVVRRPGLYLVRVDSTGPHNRFLLAGHGEVCERVLDQIDAALDEAPPNQLTVVLVHHHLLPLPEETLPERLSTRLGWPWATELRLGHMLVRRLVGRCDLVLHGHRHVPRAWTLWVDSPRVLGIYNAGCTSSLGRCRVFSHLDGAQVGQPLWLDSARVPLSPQVEPLLATGTE